MAALPKPSPPPHRMTVGEFLDWPGDSGGLTHQLVDGEPVAMSPGSATHGTLQATLAFLIESHLRRARPECRTVTEPGVVPRLRSDINLRVPDLAVTCAPDEAGQQTLPDPLLLVEVLSPSNERDTRANIWAYASIPSVAEIVLVRSTEVAVEVLRRQPDGNWPARPDKVEAGELTLESIGFSCSLQEIYARTHLAQQKQA